MGFEQDSENNRGQLDMLGRESFSFWVNYSFKTLKLFCARHKLSMLLYLSPQRPSDLFALMWVQVSFLQTGSKRLESF